MMKNPFDSSAGEVISDPQHPTINRIRALRERDERDKTGLFYAEGQRFVFQALAEQVTPEAAVFCRDLLGPCGKKLVRELQRLEVPCVSVTPDVLQNITLTVDPQGIGVVARQRWQSLEKARSHDGLCWIVVDTVQSPGNLGTMIRTGEAVGAHGLIVLNEAIDVFHPASVRATMGAVFAQNFHFVRSSPRQFLRWKAKNKCPLVGTSPAAPKLYTEVNYKTAPAIWMGGERKGLSENQQAACDEMVRLPMTGRSDSLNLAVATGIMLYEVHRQRCEVTHEKRHENE